MRIFISIVLIISSFYVSFGQEEKEFDIVIVIDDVVANNVENLKMKLTDTRGDYFTVSPKYHPGSFMVKQSQYEKMMSEDIKSIEITFSYNSEHKGKSKGYYYTINYGKKWLKEPFSVLSIYNLDRKKYKRLYEPINSDVKYSASIDFGHYSILNLKQ
ncbi:hypothetical protein [Ascidiimonas aurantiaca]|uniref:hypothetical protein n=1 Tax=Ascidiimonas aurantiaca TaxID=1685432 RepID=UPI0030ED6A87